jgi:hypothetical protein
MDYKFVLGIIAMVLDIIGYFPYFKDVLGKKTKPHLYSWLIWIITQGTATAASVYGGGKFGSLSLIMGTILVFFVFLLSFKYGTKDITRSDKIILVLALLAIVIWWQMKNPVAALFMVTAIDGFAYFITLRKCFKNPWSETLFYWIVMAIICMLSIIATAQYNLLTVTYFVTLFTLNLVVVSVCLLRRAFVKPDRATSI